MIRRGIQYDRGNDSSAASATECTWNRSICASLYFHWQSSEEMSTLGTQVLHARECHCKGKFISFTAGGWWNNNKYLLILSFLHHGHSQVMCFSIYNLYYLLAMLTPCCPLLLFAIYHRSCAIVDRTSQWQRTYKRRDQSTGETRHPQ